MGYIKHHAIIVTGQHDWDGIAQLPTIFDAHAEAIRCGCPLVTEVVGPGINATSSFLVAPDGSKEGWEDSDVGDHARDAFIEWLRNTGSYAWAEVVLGEDDGEAYVERSKYGDAPPRSRRLG